LSWCWAIPDLPQGLTAGLTYFAGITVAFGGPALGAQAPYKSGEGFAVRSDGDFGMPSGSGFYHQELVSGGITRFTSGATPSDQFKLLPGTACGFHHTINTPGETCMGFDPAAGQCPTGWVSKKSFDMSSGSGYFAWCEYQDPHQLCAPTGQGFNDCVNAANYFGMALDVGSNTDATGSRDFSACPTGAWSQSYDSGRSSGQGISWCRMGL
jgi:hypothetical protein